jgi:hypothetical protein
MNKKIINFFINIYICIYILIALRKAIYIFFNYSSFNNLIFLKFAIETNCTEQSKIKIECIKLFNFI